MSRFDIVRGQPKAWSILARSFAAGRVASTYLFHGPEGVGAWSLAIEFAALLNCESPLAEPEHPESSRPCGRCRSCRLVFDLNFEGLHLIVPIPPRKKPGEKKPRDPVDLTNEVLQLKREEPFVVPDRTSPISIPVELARDTKRKLAIRAGAGITRVVLFYQMERMLAASADALLKLIEEPPADTVLILTAVKPEGLLDTILSRAQKVRLQRLPEQSVIDYLVNVYRVSENSARLASRVCERSLGRAIASLSGEAGGGSDARSVGMLLFKALLTEPAPDVVSQMIELLNFRDRGAAEDLIRLWQSLIRDAAYFADTSDESGLVNVDFAAETKLLAGQLARRSVVARTVNTTKNTLADLGFNVHIQTALVAMVLKLKEDLEAGGRQAAL